MHESNATSFSFLVRYILRVCVCPTHTEVEAGEFARVTAGVGFSERETEACVALLQRMRLLHSFGRRFVTKEERKPDDSARPTGGLFIRCHSRAETLFSFV